MVDASQLPGNFRRKVLLITLEPISEQMAGPAIRCLEIGKQLADQFEVTVFSPHPTNLRLNQDEFANFKLVTALKRSALEDLVRQVEVVVIQANVLKNYPNIAHLAKYLVVDLYDPYLFAIHIQYENDPDTAASSFAMMHHILEQHMLEADFTICASEQQRDYWIGRFCALGRIDPALYHFDPTLRKLIDVVPFGLPSLPPQRNGPGLRETIAAIASDDPVLLWGGGIWDWFDPLTVIEATNQLRRTISNIRLVFMGTKSPNPQVPLMKMAERAQTLSQSLGLTGKHVFFPEDWVSYEHRANFLLDADIAVSAHFDLPETRYSFRTRMLDYFWAHLPIITTEGDPLADLIEASKAGITVPYLAVGAWQQAITKMLTDKNFRSTSKEASATLCPQFSWQKVVAPLRNYCSNPHHLPPYHRVTKPSLIQRAKAVYSRGGSALVIKRSTALLKDLLP